MSQFVYVHIPAASPKCRGKPVDLGYGGAIDRTPRMALRLIVGEVAQYDECEDECDETSHVPVRYRGRVAAAPLRAIRPIL
ncbi:hypothetical protein [Nocardia sp. NPDC058633]|uniref:hypothetical protein n=1 Tax=Nocardia sp. NPDC058633 TaxID=3346568 RepID=UPI003669AEEF